MPNFAIFGPAGVGKSTLAGYVYASLHPDKEYIRKMLIKFARESWYKPEQKYSYFFDRARDERDDMHSSRLKEISPNRHPGTSKYTEAATVIFKNKDVGIIDTPGAVHRSREREQGIFMAEIGIYAVQCRKMIKDSEEKTSSDLVYLGMWTNVFKKKSPPLVVVTKMDLAEFSKSEYDEVARKIRLATGNDHISIIPISIDQAAENAENILDLSSQMSWYTGPSLLEGLTKAISEVTEKSTQRLLVSMFHVERLITFPGTGRIWRGKILDGMLSIKNTVRIAPCEYFGDIIPYATATVRNLRHEQGCDTEKALTGQIVGIDLSEVKVRGRGVSKNDIRMLGYSLIFRPDNEFMFGKILQFEISKDDVDLIAERGDAMVLWYGYFISMKILHKQKDVDHGSIVLKMDTGSLSYPTNYNEGDVSKPSFVIKMRQNEGMDMAHIAGCIKSIGDSANIEITMECPKENDLNRIKKYFAKYNPKFIDGQIIFMDTLDVEDVLRKSENISAYLDADTKVCVKVDVAPNIIAK